MMEEIANTIGYLFLSTTGICGIVIIIFTAIVVCRSVINFFKLHDEQLAEALKEKD